MNLKLDAVDRAIVQATQAGLPLTTHPYEEIAEKIGAPYSMVIKRMEAMLNNGVIRRIGVVPNHYALGWNANGMTVWDIQDDHIDRLGEMVGALDYVSHCYRRNRHMPDWPYNLFAMVHGRDREEVEAKAKQIFSLLELYCQSHTILYSTKILKKTGLRI